MKSSTVWNGHSTRPSLPAGTARKGNGHLSGRRPLHLANARPFGRSKAPLGLLLLRKRELALAGGTGSSLRQRKTERSRWGTPCCTYRYRMWILAGGVRQGAPCFCFMPLFFPHSIYQMEVIIVRCRIGFIASHHGDSRSLYRIVPICKNEFHPLLTAGQCIVDHTGMI